MIRIVKALLLVLLLGQVAARIVVVQVDLDPAIVEPHAGQVLQGTLAISGTSDVPGFFSSEVAFAYSDDNTGTWFLIAAGDQPIENGILANWDTTTITDGNYMLRLRVTLDDGSTVEAIVPDLRVRNYTPVETPTPEPTVLQATPLLTPTQTATPFPPPTSLPPNPAVLTTTDISTSLVYGGLAGLAFLLVLGAYLWLRRK
jgi:hypothetical protein